MRDGDVTDMEEIVGGGLTISILTFELSAETLVQQFERKIFILLDPGFYQQIFYTETEREEFLKNLCEDQLKESKFSPLKHWIIFLSGKNTIPSVIISKLEKPKIFWSFDWFNVGQFHCLYLSVDTLQLANVFENFCTLCSQTYGLLCADLFLAKIFAREFFLKPFELEFEFLLTWSKRGEKKRWLHFATNGIILTQHTQYPMVTKQLRRTYCVKK